VERPEVQAANCIETATRLNFNRRPMKIKATFVLTYEVDPQYYQEKDPFKMVETDFNCDSAFIIDVGELELVAAEEIE
jgi:hypothetical protein